MKESGEMLNIQEVAEKIGVHHTILYKAAGKGTLKAFGRKAGSRTFYLVTLEEAERWKRKEYQPERGHNKKNGKARTVDLPNEESFDALAYIGKVTGWKVGDIVNAALVDYAAKLASEPIEGE